MHSKQVSRNLARHFSYLAQGNIRRSPFLRHRVDEQVDELGSKASQAADCVLYFVVKDLEHNSIADICTICQDLTDLLITN